MKKITKDTYLSWYEDMLFWRKFEDKLAAVYIQQKVRGFLHLYNGQEAVLAGSLHAMDLSKDKMITAYRNHVQPIGMGVDPKKVMAELYGKATGTSQGLGGSMHIFSKEHRFYGGHGIVGGQIPLGAGIAFGDKYHGSDAATLCYFGDGAARQGSLHETFNLAMLWKLPVVFICENNGYAMGTSVSRGTTLADALYRKAEGYGMTGHLIEDGMDVVAVHNQFKPIVDTTRKTGKPELVEIRTYRYKGHSMSDPRKYRTHEEEEQWHKQDPIDHLSHEMIEAGAITQEELKKMSGEVRSEIRDVVSRASEAAPPSLDELDVDVHTGTWGPFKGTSLPPMLRHLDERQEGD